MAGGERWRRVEGFRSSRSLCRAMWGTCRCLCGRLGGSRLRRHPPALRLLDPAPLSSSFIIGAMKLK